VVAKLPRGVNLAVPAKEPHRDPLSMTSTSQDTCSDARVDLHRLGTRSSAAYEASSSWEEFIAHCKDPQGDLHPAVKILPHRAAHLLDTLWRTGSTVAMKTEPWSRQRKLEALKRGSHQSANLHHTQMPVGTVTRALGHGRNESAPKPLGSSPPVGPLSPDYL
jgi:hypothetical protein